MGSVGSQRPREASMASTPHGSVVMSFSFDSGHLEEAAAGATQAQGSRTRSIPIFTDSEEPVPDDRYHAIYFAMLLAGVGFLLPYNSFITDVDYLHHKYPGGPQLRPAVHTALLARLGPAASRNPRAAPCSGGPLSSNSSSAVNCCVTPGQPLALSGSLAPLGQREEAVLCGGRCSGRGSFEPRLPPQRPPPPAGTSIVFDMSLTYILVALVAVLLNNALVERLSLHTRITAGTLPAAHRLPASPLATTHPSIPCTSLSLSVRWVRLLLGKENQVGLVGCSACRHDARSWGGCCVPHMCPGALALPCFFSTICLHGNIQLQSPAQKAPPPGSLPGAPLRPLRCPALPVLRGTAEREHSDLALCGGEGAPPAHCSLLSALASPHPGYLLALGPLLFISICDVWLQLFSRDQAYAINLAAVGTVAFGCTVQQSSFYGYTGMLPKRYTQGVMTGESEYLQTPGVGTGLSGRILTKLLLPDERAGTLIFFLVSAGLELLCFLLHLLVRGSRFVLYHTARPRHCRPSGRAGYRVHHDVAAEDVHFEHQGPALANGGSPKDSPAHEVTGGCAYTRFDVPRPRIRRSWPSFRALLLHRYVVARIIWADMLSIAVTYFITLCLFPGLESEIRHCILGEWLPILLMAVFNLSDFVGKILAALPMDWRGTHLLACSCLRVVFIPLFILCVYPSGTPALRHPAWPCVLSLLMGISNGYFGSVPMILAAGKVGPKQRELAGNTMTVSYMTGLTLGSAVAYCTYSLTRDAHRSCLRPSAANASFPAG
ncbi:hypothetical protein MJT46_020144, partial [Ovis ammon polii x Ovis aries]